MDLLSSEEAPRASAGMIFVLINFELTSLEEVVPWGSPGNHILHWFGLTDGQYWITAGSDNIFEYSDRVRRAGYGRYCKYQVARILEDITEMIPNVLEPIPQDLVKYVSGLSRRAWMDTRDSWFERNFTSDAGDETWEVLDRANLLLNDRFLDSAYLTPSTSVLLWSDDADVHIEWENGDKLVNGELAWSAVRGSFQLPRATFVEEVRAFHARLFEQMTSRIEQVEAGALHPDIHVDLPGLMAENEQRREWAAQALEKREQACWDEIRSAILEISSDTWPGDK